MLILSLLGFVHLVVANSLLSIPHPINTLNTRNLVVARQSPTGANDTIPAVCQSGCDPVNAVVSGGCPPQDCCQSSFINEYADCLECIGEALNAMDFTRAQQALNNLTEQCDSRGFNVPNLTLPGPGQGTSGALPSAPTTTMPSTNAPAQSTNAPAQSINTPAQSINAPTQSTIVAAPSTNAPTNAPAQSTDSPAQSTNVPTQSSNTTSGANQRYLLSHVQVAVVLLGGLVRLAL